MPSSPPQPLAKVDTEVERDDDSMPLRYSATLRVRRPVPPIEKPIENVPEESIEELVEDVLEDDEDDRPTLQVIPSDVMERVTPSMAPMPVQPPPLPTTSSPSLPALAALPPLPIAPDFVPIAETFEAAPIAAPPTIDARCEEDELEVPFAPKRRHRRAMIAAAVFAVSFAFGLFAAAVLTPPRAPQPAATPAFH